MGKCTGIESLAAIISDNFDAYCSAEIAQQSKRLIFLSAFTLFNAVSAAANKCYD
jgi:hypothetical protein